MLFFSGKSLIELLISLALFSTVILTSYLSCLHGLDMTNQALYQTKAITQINTATEVAQMYYALGFASSTINATISTTNSVMLDLPQEFLEVKSLDNTTQIQLKWQNQTKCKSLKTTVNEEVKNWHE